MQRVWQIAAGESGRKYGDLFLQHDVMFCGPGRFGPFDDTAYSTAASSGRVSTWTLAAIRRFAQEVSPGDIVLLRSGYRVDAIGLVPEQPYFHSSTFDDVFGWDLEHVCRVIWQQELAEELAEIQSAGPLFANRKQIPTFTAVSDPAILEPIQHLFARCQSRSLKPLPPEPPPPLTMDELANALFQRGLAFDAVDKLRAALEKQRRLIEWYRNSQMAGERPIKRMPRRLRQRVRRHEQRLLPFRLPPPHYHRRPSVIPHSAADKPYHTR